MKLNFSSETLVLLEVIQQAMRADQELYLVGGAVRDVLLGKEIHDLDFVMGSDPTPLAKRVAQRLKVGFFVLDDDRHTTRVLKHNPDGKVSPLDFVQFTGDGLSADLYHRDFTINAMAVNLRDLSTVIDPFNGQVDLKKKLLQPCSQTALLDDPVRVLRGIRLAHQFDLDYGVGLEALMLEAALNLPRTAFERQRDEFFRILEGPEPALGMSDCRRVGIFQTMIPSIMDLASIPALPPHTLPLFDHTLRVVDYLDRLITVISQCDAVIEEPWWLRVAQSELSVFSAQVDAYIHEELTVGRSKKGLALLGALLHDIGKPSTMKQGEDQRLHFYGHDRLGAKMAREAAKRIQLSNVESEWIKTLVRYHMRLLPMINRGGLPTRHEVYQFYKHAGDAGVAIALHALADIAATYEHTLTLDKWQRAVQVSKVMLSAWWKHKDEVISPHLFLNGDDLQAIFSLTPGRKIGHLLKKLEEAQASGHINSRAEAEAFIRDRLSHHKKGEHEL